MESYYVLIEKTNNDNFQYILFNKEEDAEKFAGHINKHYKNTKAFVINY